MFAKSFRSPQSLKSKKIHMQSILKEVKVKKNIDELDGEKKIYRHLINNDRMREKDSMRMSTYETEKSIDKEAMIQDFLQFKKNLKESDRNSMIDYKLAEIVKYANLYPSRKNKTYFSAEKRYQTEIQNEYEAKKRQEKKKFKLKKKRRFGGIFKKININKNYFIDLIHDHPDIEEITTEQNILDTARGRADRKIPQIKTMMETVHEARDEKEKFSLDYFIKANARFSEFDRIKEKNQRKGSLWCSLHEWKKMQILGLQKNFDLREQNVDDVSCFIRGGEREESQEYSKFVYIREHEKMRRNFDLYDKICRKIEGDLKGKRIILQEMSKPTMSNLLYLKDSIDMPNNSYSRLKQIKQTLHKLKVMP